MITRKRTVNSKSIFMYVVTKTIILKQKEEMVRKYLFCAPGALVLRLRVPGCHEYNYSIFLRYNKRERRLIGIAHDNLNDNQRQEIIYLG